MAKMHDSLAGLDRKQRANKKCDEIIKMDIKNKCTHKKISFQIEKIEKIEGGVSVYLRAWNGKNRIGFGSDGTVEIERFRVFNPPLLVDDPNGDIEIEEVNPRTQEVTIRRLREDPFQALRESLLHTIQITGKGSKNIIDGKVGNTTSTFYPSMDGGVATLDSASGWAAVRGDTTGNYPNYTATTLQDGGHGFACGVKTYGSSDFNIIRAFTIFDTSSLPDGDVISSATLSLYVTGAYYNLEDNAYTYVAPVSGSPASDSALVEADIDNVGATAFATGIRTNAMTTNAYVDWTLNASGLAAISKTDKTRFAWREGHDLENQTPASVGNAENGIQARASEYSGTSSDPKLIVVHGAGLSETNLNRSPIRGVMRGVCRP